MDYRNSFSFRLSSLRKYKGISRTKLSDYLDVSDEAVRLLEKCRRSPSFEVLCALADYFDVSTDYLIGRSNDDTPMSFHSEWEEAFRERFAEEYRNCDSADLEAACIDREFCEQIIDGTAPLRFHTACDLADELGVSLDYLVGRTDKPEVNK